MNTQARQVLEHLRRGHTLTALEALRLYGIGRLAARVRDLREQGYMIEAMTIAVVKANGRAAHVASYSLPVPATSGDAAINI